MKFWCLLYNVVSYHFDRVCGTVCIEEVVYLYSLSCSLFNTGLSSIVLSSCEKNLGSFFLAPWNYFIDVFVYSFTACAFLKE